MRILSDLALGALDPPLDLRPQEEIYEHRVELGAPTVADGLERGGVAAARLVAARVGDGVEAVGHGHDPRGGRNGPAGEAARISAAVPPLVVTEHTLGEAGIERAQWREHFSAATRVGEDGLAVGLGELLIAIMDDVEERRGDLADIVEEGDAFDLPLLGLVESGGLGENDGGCGDTTHVPSGIGVVGVDGEEEGFEGCGAESFGRLARITFTHPGEGECGGRAGGG